MNSHINFNCTKQICLAMAFILCFSLPIQAKNPSQKSDVAPTPKSYSTSSDTLDTLTRALKNLKTAQAVVANNIANAETTGFKKSRAVFADQAYRHEMLSGAQDSAGQYSPAGISIGSGNRVAAIQIDFSQGTLEQTGGELDLAVEGSGFLQVQNPVDNATLYTRAGKLSKNPNGQLAVCSAGIGRLLEPPIQIPQDALGIVIGAEGQVSVRQPGNVQLQSVGQIQLATFVNPQGLLSRGENLYQETDSSGPPTISNPGQNGIGVLRQGYTEASNVDLDDEIREFKRLGRACRKIEFLLDAE
jgi:flagellar basal-body rod protein FlgG